MQDSKVSVEIEVTNVDGSVKKLHYFGAEAEKAAQKAAAAFARSSKVADVQVNSNDNLASSQNRVTQATNRAAKAQESYGFHIAKTTVLSLLVNKSFLELTNAMGAAVKQADLIQNFPASMAALGLSAEEASKGFAVLRDYTQSVGGDLTKAATTVSRFAGVNRNITASVAQYAGLNNALIAGGASTEVQASALEQLTQAYSRGRPQLIEYKSALVAMQPQLDQIADKMGFVNAGALGDALTAGEVSMQSFMTELTKLGTGTGAIAQQAAARMQGIEFAANVMKNTLVNGLVAIYTAIGRDNIVAFMTTLTGVIQTLAHWVANAVTAFITLLNVFRKFLGMAPITVKMGEATGAINTALADASSGAGDLADGLGDAGDAAKKTEKAINKGLASFDKMNVLADKTSPDSGAGGSGGKKDNGSSLSGAGALGDNDVSALGDAFGNLGKKLQEASKWAQILAGILAALALNGLIKGIFGVNPLKEFGKAMTKHVFGPLGHLAKVGAVSAGTFVGTFGTALARGLAGLGSGGSGIMGTAAGIGAKIGLGIRAGFIGAFTGFGALLRVALILPLALIGAIFIETLTVLGFAGLAAITIPFWGLVAIGAIVVAAIVGIFYLIWTNWDAIWGFMLNTFNVAWRFIVDLWQQLYDVFGAPLKWLLKFVGAIFILIVAIVAIFIEGIVMGFVSMVSRIFGVLKAVSGFVNQYVIQPVWQLFQGLWDGAVNLAVAAWQWIFEKVLRPIGDFVYRWVIKPVFDFFKGLWEGISGGAGGMWNILMNILGGMAGFIYHNTISPILNTFNWLWDRIRDGLSFLMSGLSTLFGGLTNILKTPINGIIDLINKALGGLNKIKVPDWVPGLGGKGVNFPMIPKLARGGIVSQATLAQVGENGKEAIVPLENNLEWLDKLAAKINGPGSGNGQPVQIIVQVGEEKIVSKVIDLINERTQMSGRNAIYV